jgi:hypothetical protein
MIFCLWNQDLEVIMGSTLLVELSSKDYVRSLSISDKSKDRVFVEGDLGTLLHISIIEKRALEIVAEKGVLRVDIDEDILQRVLESKTRELDLTSNIYAKVKE